MKRHTLTFKMIILFLLISIPALILSMFAGQANLQSARDQLINAEKSTMRMLIRQYDTALEAVEKNLQTTLYGTKEYPALRLERTETRYQQSLIWLKDELTAFVGYYPQLAGIYVYIPHSEDFFLVKNGGWVALEDQEALYSALLSGQSFLNTEIFASKSHSFIIKSMTNTYMEIGYMISADYLKELLSQSLTNDEFVQFEVDHQTIEISYGNKIQQSPDMGGYETFSIDFEHADIKLNLWIPDVKLSTMIPIKDRLLWYFSFILIILLPLFLLAMRRIFLVPMKKLSGAMGEILSGNSAYRINNFSRDREFLEIEQAFNRTLDHNETLKIQAYEYRLQKEEQQLISLKLQINPHLLLNSLNTIYSLSENNKNQEIKEFSMNLAKYFRYSLRDSEEYVTIASELEFIKSYSKVQKIRYPDAFYLMFDVDESLMEERIPPLIIQNFVENSAKYALIPGMEIEIFVIIKKREDFLDISICDNGKGMDEELLSKLRSGEIITDSRGKHIGIWNCRQRLQSFYGGTARLQITSKPGEGTQIWLHIPSSPLSEVNSISSDSNNKFMKEDDDESSDH